MKKTMLVLLFMTAFFISSCMKKHKALHVEYMMETCLIPTKGNKFKLCDSMIVKVDNKYHAIPRGFKTDLASIPRLMWPVFAPGDYDSIAPSVVHDWHYCCVKGIDRKVADEVFYYGLKLHGMNSIKAYIYYLGVRAFGSSSYKNGEGILLHLSEFDKNELYGIYEDINYGLG